MVDIIGWPYITFIMWHVWHGLEITMNARNMTEKEKQITTPVSSNMINDK